MSTAILNAAVPPVTLAEAAPVWTRIAALSFGGPAGQIAVTHRGSDRGDPQPRSLVRYPHGVRRGPPVRGRPAAHRCSGARQPRSECAGASRRGRPGCVSLEGRMVSILAGCAAAGVLLKFAGVVR